MDKKNTALIKINENSIIYKIKKFFTSLFKKNVINNNNETISDGNDFQDTASNNFLSELNVSSNEHFQLLRLQEQYENGDISGENLTQEQLNNLFILYYDQIQDIKMKIGNNK